MATQRPSFTRYGTDLNAENSATTSRDDEEKIAIDNKTASADAADADGSPLFDATQEDHFGEAAVLTDAKDVLTHVIHVDDDPTLSPWTLRAWFIGELHHFVHVRLMLSLTFTSHWARHLRISPAGDLLFQATSHLCLGCVHDRCWLCPWRAPRHDSTKGRAAHLS
jgi:hypothetical protein